MMVSILRSLLVFMIPIVLCLAAGSAMNRLAGRTTTQSSLGGAHPEDKPLYERIEGYDKEAIARYWGKLDADGISMERRFLELDLVYPFVYGGILASALLYAWTALGRPFSVLWLVSPVIFTVVADWIENLTQLRQLDRFNAGGASALESLCVSMGSFATIGKLVCLIASVALLLCLAFWLCWQERSRT